MARHTRPRGFTLVEITIVVTIAAVLATIALPNLLDQLRKARRADAYALLAAAQHAQERWRSRSTQYTTDLSPSGLGLAGQAGSALYDLTVDHADARGYAITASARPGTTQAADGRCARLRVRVDGGFVFHGSAAGDDTSFDESSANRCWGR